jgi:hypothetical protein
MAFVSTPADPVVRLLEQRREAAARWRQCLRELAPADALPQALFARLESGERQHAERLASELPMMAPDVWVCLARTPEGAAVQASMSEASVTRAIASLEQAIGEQMRLQAVFECLAADALDAELRLRALALALAGARHLKTLSEAVSLLRCKL